MGHFLDKWPITAFLYIIDIMYVFLSTLVFTAIFYSSKKESDPPHWHLFELNITMKTRVFHLISTIQYNKVPHVGLAPAIPNKTEESNVVIYHKCVQINNCLLCDPRENCVHAAFFF
jgi:hypothetical protein